jgi:hypothetical protein
VSEFQSASRTKFEAERDFTRAHDQLAGGAEVTRLEQAALRLYAATKRDRERSAQMLRLVCEHEGDPDEGKYDRPCWKSRVEFVDDGSIERLWPSAGGEDEGSGHPESWCEPCQQRQKLYEDKSVRQELGNAKRAFWAACRAAEKEVRT